MPTISSTFSDDLIVPRISSCNTPLDTPRTTTTEPNNKEKHHVVYKWWHHKKKRHVVCTSGVMLIQQHPNSHYDFVLLNGVAWGTRGGGPQT